MDVLFMAAWVVASESFQWAVKFRKTGGLMAENRGAFGGKAISVRRRRSQVVTGKPSGKNRLKTIKCSLLSRKSRGEQCAAGHLWSLGKKTVDFECFELADRGCRRGRWNLFRWAGKLWSETLGTAGFLRSSWVVNLRQWLLCANKWYNLER